MDTSPMPAAGYEIISPMTEMPLQSAADVNTVHVLQHWQRLCASRLAPAWRDIDLLAFGVHQVPRLMVVDVIRDPLDFHYRFFGTWHADCHKYDMTGKRVSDYRDPADREQVAVSYREIVAARRPKLFGFEMRLQNIAYKCEILRLPLSNNDRDVDGILVSEALVS